MDDEDREEYLESILAESFDTNGAKNDGLSTIREENYSQECGSTTTDFLHNRFGTRASKQPSVISFDKKSQKK